MTPIVRRIGQSRLGRPIVATTIGKGPPTLIVIPGVHGDEPLGPGLAKRWLRALSLHPPRHVRVVIVDAANPDGLKRKQKNNAADVDLNRNFPSRNWGTQAKPRYNPGATPASEPETRALLSLIRRYSRPAQLYLLTLHEPFGFVNFDGGSRAWARAIARANGYAVRASVGYPTPGSLGTFFGIERRTPVITLECERESIAVAWRRHRPALDAALAYIESITAKSRR